MATYTAGDQINRALRLLGVLAEGETPSASESDDALVALNQMLDSWNLERLAVYTTQTQTLSWPAGQATRTLGPTGTLVGTRPIALDDSTYFVMNGISYPIQIVNVDQYNSIALKTVSSPIPMVVYVEPTFPDTTITLYPVPSQDIEFHFVSVLPLAEPVSLATSLAFPPGYMRAFAYNLALEIAPEFGAQPSHDVRRIATTSKRNIKRINDPGDLMSMPAAVLPHNTAFNIFSGD